jgi:hypothetical protein
MVELVSLVGHRYRVDDLAERGRAGLRVDDRERVRLREVGAEQQRVGEIFRRSFHRKLRGCVEGRIRSYCHRTSPPFHSRRMTTLVSGRACALRAAESITTIEARLYTLVRMTARCGTAAVLAGSISPPAGGGFDRQVDSKCTDFQHPAGSIPPVKD